MSLNVKTNKFKRRLAPRRGVAPRARVAAHPQGLSLRGVPRGLHRAAAENAHPVHQAGAVQDRETELPEGGGDGYLKNAFIRRN